MRPPGALQTRGGAMKMRGYQSVFTLGAAVAASLAFGLQAASADAPQLLGGLHLFEYCQAHGWDTVIFPRGQLAPHAAVDNWACASGDESIPISMEQACKWEYGL